MRCVPKRTGRGIVCEKCKYVFPVAEAELEQWGGDLNKISRRCKVLGLGDYAAAFLAIWGVTPERVNAIRKRLGLKKPCKCDKRRDQFNELGRKLGL